MTHPIHGLDGKFYPMPLTADELDFVIGRCHYLRHDEHLSVRQIKARLESENGLRRSVGSIAAYLKQDCTECSGGASNPPEQSGGGA